jgi:uncharacterized membrane protein
MNFLNIFLGFYFFTITLIIGYLDRITNEKDEKSKEKIGKIVLLEFVKDNPIYIQYGNAPEMFIVADVLSIKCQK